MTDTRRFLPPLTFSLLLILHGTVGAQTPGPDDEHWFYDYDGPAPEPFVLELQGSHLYAGGIFLSTAGDATAKNLARFDLQTEAWEPVPGLAPVLNGSVRAAHAADNGMLYFGGNFSDAAGTAARGVVEFDPATDTWTALTDPNPTLVTPGQESGPTNGAVRALVKIGPFLYVGGEYTGHAGAPDNEKYIRRFHLDDRRWSRVGDGLDFDVRALAALPDGSLLAGGAFTDGLARWDGASWTTFAGGVRTGEAEGAIVRALAVEPDGTVYAGGEFTEVGAGVAVHDIARFRQGQGWSGMAGGFDSAYIQSNGTTFVADGVWDLAVAGPGQVYAGGDFQASAGRTNTGLDHVAFWDGSGSWQNLGSGVGTTGSQIVNCLAVGLKGDLYVGGTFSEGYRNASSANTQFSRWYPGRDFTDYVPGAAENPTVAIIPDADRFAITLRTRPGTTYEIESSSDGSAWAAIGGTTVVGDGGIQGFFITPPAGAGERFYRFRAVSY